MNNTLVVPLFSHVRYKCFLRSFHQFYLFLKIKRIFDMNLLPVSLENCMKTILSFLSNTITPC